MRSIISQHDNQNVVALISHCCLLMWTARRLLKSQLQRRVCVQTQVEINENTVNNNNKALYAQTGSKLHCIQSEIIPIKTAPIAIGPTESIEQENLEQQSSSLLTKEIRISSNNNNYGAVNERHYEKIRKLVFIQRRKIKLHEIKFKRLFPEEFSPFKAVLQQQTESDNNDNNNIQPIDKTSEIFPKSSHNNSYKTTSSNPKPIKPKSNSSPSPSPSNNPLHAANHYFSVYSWPNQFIRPLNARLASHEQNFKKRLAQQSKLLQEISQNMKDRIFESSRNTDIAKSTKFQRLNADKQRALKNLEEFIMKNSNKSAQIITQKIAVDSLKIHREFYGVLKEMDYFQLIRRCIEYNLLREALYLFDQGKSRFSSPEKLFFTSNTVKELNNLFRNLLKTYKPNQNETIQTNNSSNNSNNNEITDSDYENQFIHLILELRNESKQPQQLELSPNAYHILFHSLSTQSLADSTKFTARSYLPFIRSLFREIVSEPNLLKYFTIHDANHIFQIYNHAEKYSLAKKFYEELCNFTPLQLSIETYELVIEMLFFNNNWNEIIELLQKNSHLKRSINSPKTIAQIVKAYRIVGAQQKQQFSSFTDIDLIVELAGNQRNLSLVYEPAVESLFQLFKKQYLPQIRELQQRDGEFAAVNLKQQLLTTITNNLNKLVELMQAETEWNKRNFNFSTILDSIIEFYAVQDCPEESCKYLEIKDSFHFHTDLIQLTQLITALDKQTFQFKSMNNSAWKQCLNVADELHERVALAGLIPYQTREIAATEFNNQSPRIESVLVIDQVNSKSAALLYLTIRALYRELSHSHVYIQSFPGTNMIIETDKHLVKKLNLQLQKLLATTFGLNQVEGRKIESTNNNNNNNGETNKELYETVIPGPIMENWLQNLVHPVK